MHRLAQTRRLLHAVAARTYSSRITGITGLAVHPDPLPVLVSTYQANLDLLQSVPDAAAYRQSTEALLKRSLRVVNKAIHDLEGDNAIATVETQLQQEHVEMIIQAADDELALTKKMIEWKAWEPLEDAPAPGQWEYFGTESRS